MGWVSTATRLFQHPDLMPGHYPRYDVSADGQRFVLTEWVGDETVQPSVWVVMNWFAEFPDRQ